MEKKDKEIIKKHLPKLRKGYKYCIYLTHFKDFVMVGIYKDNPNSGKILYRNPASDNPEYLSYYVEIDETTDLKDIPKKMKGLIWKKEVFNV